MTALTVKIFPACAVLISVFACFFPAALSGLGFLIVPLLGLIMAGMGATLAFGDFVHAVKKPKAVFIGVALQFILMPLIAFIAGHLLNLPREQFIGLVMVGTVAGGTASNVIAYLAGGDVALSITLTACSTVIGIIYLGDHIKPVVEDRVDDRQRVTAEVLEYPSADGVEVLL